MVDEMKLNPPSKNSAISGQLNLDSCFRRNDSRGDPVWSPLLSRAVVGFAALHPRLYLNKG